MKKAILLIIWIAVFQLIGFAMGQITDASIDPWYLGLTKSSLTPPGYVFGIVWGILYAMLAITGWQLFHNERADKVRSLRLVYSCQMILNWAWTPVFFYAHLIASALVCLITIVLLTFWCLVLAFRQSKITFWFLLPYFIWVCFASYLNAIIWLAN